MILLSAFLGEEAEMNSSHRPSSTRGKARQQAGVPLALRDSDGQRTIFFTIADVAERLNVCERTVRRWIKSRALPVHRIGSLVRIEEADFATFLALRRDA
jgi:excisionase family DNA binding protein